MKHYAMFSVGDYELPDEYLAEFGAREWIGNLFKPADQKFRHTLSADQISPPADIPAGRPAPLNPNAIDTSQVQRSGLTPAARPGLRGRVESAVKNVGSGIRKGYTRIVDGKAQFIPQGLKTVGKSTAGALKAGVELAGKNKLATAGVAGAGLAALGGAYALSKRSKRERR